MWWMHPIMSLRWKSSHGSTYRICLLFSMGLSFESLNVFIFIICLTTPPPYLCVWMCVCYKHALLATKYPSKVKLFKCNMIHYTVKLLLYSVLILWHLFPFPSFILEFPECKLWNHFSWCHSLWIIKKGTVNNFHFIESKIKGVNTGARLCINGRGVA